MSTLSQFAPFAGGGLKSFQTGFISTNMNVGSGEDVRYLDITVSAVVTAKTIGAFQGSLGSNTHALYSGYGGEDSGIATTRMISTTSLRLANNRNIAAYLSGRWQLAEAN